MPAVKNKQIINIFHQLDWPHLKFTRSSINIVKDKKKLPVLTIRKGKCKLYFYWYDVRKEEYNPRKNIEFIEFTKEFKLKRILKIDEREYHVYLIRNIKRILDIPNDIVKFAISQRDTKMHLSPKKRHVLISSKSFMRVLDEAFSIYNRSNKYRNAYERYLINIAIEKFINRKVERKTLISPGDLNFTIQRLNLSTKRKKSDFNNYVNKNDISSVQNLAATFIKNEMFDKDFLRRLNNYFIKENLIDIIKLGKEILDLKSPKLNTVKAKEIISQVAEKKKKIKQLETLWQKYFENYLLYLIFSYKAIFPKIKLKDIEGDKKEPDFIGINHYNGVDIIEIKTHLKNALVYDKSHDNFAFSAELSKAIIQTMNYMDAVIHTKFRNPHDGEKITNSSHEENLNRPRGIIIISSYDKLIKSIKNYDKDTIERDFTKLRNSVHNIEILTFDEIINIADDYIQRIISRESTLEDESSS